jgi:hypothetical protein
VKLRATLDEGPGTHEFKQSYCSKALNLVLRPVDNSPRPKSSKLRLIWHLFWRENHLVGTKRQC